MKSARANRAVRTPGGLSVRLDVRALTAVLLLLLAGLGASVLLIGTGDFPIGAGDVLRTLFGGGNAGQEFIVNELRLPRVLVGLLVGASLGLGGALFQALSRNPLGSPDILGLGQGATAGALVVIVLFSGSAGQVTVGALVGGLATGLAIYLLAWKRGVHGYRLVLVGIGMSAIMTAVNGYLLTKADLVDAARAVVWMTGSLSGRDWDQVWPLLALCGLLVPLVLANARGLRMMEMGDDVSYALGVRVERVRLLLMLAAVLLAAAATAALSLTMSLWAAALIVTGVLFALAAVLAATGRAQLRRAAPPTPEEALGSVRTDVEEIKERAHR
ncbi:iron chelate uptake ABC transporter family permease subunit [Streptomyces sp. Lzd4kr]|nr:iron chelate uptake ABC transporter family permease subunit [Streptomyces sp. Lzd4kr]